ncbi:FMN-binding negative transcriptional regulator [Mucilaginibacter gotjawali]|uniref:Protease synthase and sporulation protein PAI 2 n=2 Tax=Mucilaginibacter gotjawali TaxID=1550579 RepID=A0A110B3J9_9SPHI|nr:FMN-binding negative transcriptional regulator [Mucilaginibacter gotjawali]MBB3055910.1 transcriptional regulator [Mucilaginibacter gotjawali]BAU54733.1 Protease synthase and sporulation protein PAI 2 [Mucilaginibacter gotjawali]
MYIPPFNKFENQQEAIAFMQRYSFATIVTVKDGLPVATHLPFLVEEKDGIATLRSHFAKANPQAAESIDTKVLVIFTEPHAYISPKHYEKVESVPTWNYLAVHAYGKFKLLEGEEHKAALLKATIRNFEAEYLKQWESLPDKYKQNMMKGIVAFEIVVDDLQAKAKLSQNRSETERENIIGELGRSENTSEKDVATYMASLGTKP